MVTGQRQEVKQPMFYFILLDPVVYLFVFCQDLKTSEKLSCKQTTNKNWMFFLFLVKSWFVYFHVHSLLFILFSAGALLPPVHLWSHVTVCVCINKTRVSRRIFKLKVDQLL